MDFAEKDWVSVVIEKSNVIVLARIETLKRESQVTVQETGGILGMRRLRLLEGADNEILPEFDLAFLQFKEAHRRIKSGGQGWNGIEIQPAKLIVLAAPHAEGRSGVVVEPIAVSEVSSENDPLIRGIEGALTIEKERDPNELQRMLSQALWSDLPVLGSYAQFSVGLLKRIPREKAIELDSALALDQSVPVSQRLSAAATLERALWKDNASEDIGNKRILSVLFAFLGAPQPDVHRSLIPMLYRLLITQVPEKTVSARDYRALLLGGVVLPEGNALRNLQVMKEDASLGKEASALLSTLTNP